jgi:hypothetical protein
VRATIVEHGKGIIAESEHDERLVADRPRERRAADLAAQRRDVPLL